jgi:gag-polypeptide of LTR copia-type
MSESVANFSKPNDIAFQVPKLRDDGSNWTDYETRIRRAMGAKGVLRILEGTAIVPQMYNMVGGVYVTMDGKTPASEDQIETREEKIVDYEKRSNLAEYMILTSVSSRMGSLIRNLKSAKEMWEKVKEDCTNKSTIHVIDAEAQFAAMRCSDNSDPTAHVSEMKAHLELMEKRFQNLNAIGSTWDGPRYSQAILSSLPESYRPIVQTLSVQRESTGKLPDSSALYKIIVNEANHHLIQSQNGSGSAMYASDKGKKAKKLKKKFTGECFGCGVLLCIPLQEKTSNSNKK